MHRSTAESPIQTRDRRHEEPTGEPRAQNPPPPGRQDAPAIPPHARGTLQATWHDDALHLWRAEQIDMHPSDDPSDHGTSAGAIARLPIQLDGVQRFVSTSSLTGAAMLAELESVARGSGDRAEAGESLECLAKLLSFVKGAVAREQFYPSAHREGGEVKATWRLLITADEDVERLEAYAAAMPGACFCANGPKADRLESVESFLNAACDALVRRSLTKDEFFAGVHENAATPGADAEVRWVSALLKDDERGRRVEGRDAEVAELLDKVQTWTARLGSGAGEPWRLRFVLEEPGANESAGGGSVDTLPAGDGSLKGGEVRVDEERPRYWPLRLELLPPLELADTHVPLPARQVWEQPAGSIGFIGRNAVRLRERLTAELGRAAEYCQPLGRVASEASRLQPDVVMLTTDEAFRVIRDWAEVLREAGFEVQLPSWAGTRQSRLEVVMELSPAEGTPDPTAGDAGSGAGGSRVGLESLLRFNWRVAVGDQSLSAEEFRALVDRQEPLVRREGQWIEVDPDAARAAAELIERRPPGALTLGEAFRMGFGMSRGLTSNGAAPAVRLAGTEWVAKLLEQAPEGAGEVPQPPSFHGTLRPYQLRGLQWMAFLDRLGLGGCLADDMGLGKTIELIALLLHEQERRPSWAPVLPTLLFVPTSVLGNWKREIARFGPSLRVMLHHGPQRFKGDEFRKAAEACDVVITSYALSHRDQADLRQVTWGRLALDEAQKIKNPTAASSVAIRSLAAPRRVALTGTPVENHLGELWSIMDTLNPGLLGSQGEFREKFAVPIEKQQDRGRARRLREMIRPFVLRRTKDDPEVAADLPEKMEMNVYCGLTGEQAAAYERICSEMIGRIDTASGIRRRGLILSVLTKLKQVCDHPALLAPETPRTLVRSGKAQRLAEMLEEVIEEGEKALVFTQYRQMGDILVEILQKRLGRETLFLHGGTPQPRRDEMVQQFQRPDPHSPKVFILSLRAGGLGLNLTAASHVFHFDRWWNPAVENQATDRAHRIGQVRRVQVHKFVSIGTVEERIDRMLAEKSQLAANIVGSGDDWLTELSTSELREYLSLNREAVTEGGEGVEDEFADDPDDPWEDTSAAEPLEAGRA